MPVNDTLKNGYNGKFYGYVYFTRHAQPQQTSWVTIATTETNQAISF